MGIRDTGMTSFANATLEAYSMLAMQRACFGATI